MEIRLEKCLRYNTVLNHLLEPHWGNICVDYCSEDFSIKIEGVAQVVIDVLGLKFYSWEGEYGRDKITSKIYLLIGHMEENLAKYASSNSEFYRYPVFVLFQLLTISDIGWLHEELSLKYKHCKLSVSENSRNIRLTIGSETTNIPLTSMSSVKRLTEDMINHNWPANFYSESP